MEQTQADVRAFHTKFGLAVASHPMFPTEQEFILRISLIQEELSEMLVAYRNRNFIDFVDSMGDLKYVVDAVPVVSGVDMEPIMREIQYSNMSKSFTLDEGGKIQKGVAFVSPRILNLLSVQKCPSELLYPTKKGNNDGKDTAGFKEEAGSSNDCGDSCEIHRDPGP